MDNSRILHRAGSGGLIAVAIACAIVVSGVDLGALLGSAQPFTGQSSVTLSADNARSSPSSMANARLAVAGGSMPRAEPHLNGSAATWTFLTTANFGCGAGGGALAYDAADSYVMHYGGYSGECGSLGGAAFKNGTWTNLPGGYGPGGRESTSMVYDAADGYVLLYGGYADGCLNTGPDACNDTWEYRAGVWTELTPRCYYLGTGLGNCSGLPKVGAVALVYDAVDGYVLLDTGSGTTITSRGDYGTWAYRNDTWTFLSENFTSRTRFFTPSSLNVAYDASDGYAIAFGGQAPGAASHLGSQGNNYTWKWSSGAWTNITRNVTGAPSPRMTAGMVHDSTGGSVILYGGINFVCTHFSVGGCQIGWDDGNFTSYADTWSFSSGGWTELLPTSTAGYDSTPPLLVDDLGDRSVIKYSEGSCSDSNCSVGVNGGGTWAWGTTPPISNLSIAARTAVDVGIAMNLTAAFNGGTPSVTVQWAFGDGQGASGRLVAHSYGSPGNRTVKVWVNDSLAHANASLAIVVYPGAAASPFASPNPTDVGLPSLFKTGILGGAPPYSFNWSFGDGNWTSYACPYYWCSSSEGSVVHAYSDSGSYEVRVSVAFSTGAVLNESFSLRVNVDPSPLRLNATPDPAVLLQPVIFTASFSGGTPPYSYTWAFGDGGTGRDLSTIAHVYTTTGPFYARVTARDASGWEQNASLTISIALTLSISANATLGASPLETAFSSEVLGGIPAYTYSWQFGDGSNSSLPDPNHLYESAGLYHASLQVWDSSHQTVLAYWTLQVFPGGGPLQLSVQATATALVVGGGTNLTLSPSGGTGNYNLTWTSIPTGCAQLSVLTVNCIATQNGTFTATARVTDSLGHSAVGAIAFTVGSKTTPPPIGTNRTSGNGESGFLGLPGHEGVYLLVGLAAAATAVIVATLLVTRRQP